MSNQTPSIQLTDQLLDTAVRLRMYMKNFTSYKSFKFLTRVELEEKYREEGMLVHEVTADECPDVDRKLYDIYRLFCPSGMLIDSHMHYTSQEFRLIRGRVIMWNSFGEHHFSAGDSWKIDSFTLHSYEFVTDTEMYVIFFPKVKI